MSHKNLDPVLRDVASGIRLAVEHPSDMSPQSFSNILALARELPPEDILSYIDMDRWIEDLYKESQA